MVQQESVNTQWGSGLNQGATETAHLYTKSVVQATSARSSSVALICVDLRTAFASLFRDLSFPTSDKEASKQLLAKRLLEVGFEETEAGEVYDDIYGEGDADGEQHLNIFLTALTLL